jgi:hypothetical protein
LRGRAADALKAETRWAMAAPELEAPPPLKAPRLVVSPAGSTVPRSLLDEITRTRACAEEECRLVLDATGRAVLLVPNCSGCQLGVRLFDVRPDGGWVEASRPADGMTAPIQPANAPPPPTSIEVRTIETRRVYLDGKPVGPVFDQPS